MEYCAECGSVECDFDVIQVNEYEVCTQCGAENSKKILLVEED